ncbi:LOW QUALITY PROTEIN: hypothetical protein ACHAWU_007820 [Discostella pseudostelligera]|uniref:Uncharacterized protein n=1 Tax=Discostella pseudostelligera TaxID=259834 RepID=A0ABD3N3A3_9STRA
MRTGKRLAMDQISPEPASRSSEARGWAQSLRQESHQADGNFHEAVLHRTILKTFIKHFCLAACANLTIDALLSNLSLNTHITKASNRGINFAQKEMLD